MAALRPTCKFSVVCSQGQVVSCFNRAVPLLNVFRFLVCDWGGPKGELRFFFG